MKSCQYLCILVLFLLTLRSFSIKIKLDKITWSSTTSTTYSNVKVWYPDSKLSSTKVNQLIDDIPKDQIEIAASDILVVNTDAIFWFVNKGSQDNRKTITSGGLLGGIWEIKKVVDTNNVNYSLRPDNNKANLLKKEIGMQIIGKYSNGDGTSNQNIFWGLERCKDSAETSNSGKAIDINEGGIYSDNGFKLEFKGSIINQLVTSSNGSNKQTAAIDNFASETDTDPSKDIGTSSYILTWKIPADKSELSCQFSINPQSGQMLVSQVDWNINYQAKIKITSVSDPTKSIDVAYEAVSAPELMVGNKDTSLANVDINKYFTNSCVKSLFDYEFKDTSKAFSIKSPPGRGQVLCLGAPLFKISFACVYPNNDNLPKEAYEDYTLNIVETKGTDTRQLGFTYSLLDSKVMTLNSSQIGVLGLRIKTIDATPAIATR